MYLNLFIIIHKYTIVPWKKKLCKLIKCSIGYSGSDVVGNTKNVRPPTIPPVARNTSPAFFINPFPTELNKPEYKSKLQ